MSESDEKVVEIAHAFSPWHVAVAAEAVAAALFARCGCDVSVQYGANQPEYDLIVARGDRLLKVSVKGSKDGSWGLCQSLITPGKADYHAAIDKWRQRHCNRVVLCFVQFKGADLLSMPRVYVATPLEVAERLRATANGRGDTILHEQRAWTSRAYAAGTVDRIPPAWRFSPERVEQMLCNTEPA